MAVQAPELVAYDITEASIATTKAACASLSASTPKGYEEVRVAIANIRETRVAIEKRRVELKADALEYGRRVDAEAKRLTGMLLAIEEPLKAMKADVDYERSRLRAEKEAAEKRAVEERVRAERAAEEARLKAEREAEEERLRVLRVAEEARLAEERARLAVERKRMEEERLKAEAERRAEEAKAKKKREAEEAALRAEREAIEAERRRVAAERERAERAEFERIAKIKAEDEARLQAERDRVAAIELAARLDALKPDLEKVRAFAQAIRSVQQPKVKSRKVAAVIASAVAALEHVAADLDKAASAPRAVA